MNFDTFIKKYGTGTTNNFQLIKWAKDLKIPNFHYAMRDEIPKLPIQRLPLNAIVNIHSSKEKGVHHSGLHITPSRHASGKLVSPKVIFFDSYALPPTEEIKKLTKNFIDRDSNTFKFQDFGTSYCGQITLYVLYKLSQGEDFIDILLSLKNVQ